MSRRRYAVLCCLVLAGSFAGAFVANRAIPVAHAQDVLPFRSNDVRATSLTLVDARGNTEAVLRSGPAGAEFTLRGPAGRSGSSAVEISGSGAIVIRDQNGRVLWRSPRGGGVLPASE